MGTEIAEKKSNLESSDKTMVSEKDEAKNKKMLLARDLYYANLILFKLYVGINPFDSVPGPEYKIFC